MPHSCREFVGMMNACGSFPTLGVPFGGPHNKDYSLLGQLASQAFWVLSPKPADMGP